jgi:DNA-binding transcriptional regulator YbjK
MKSAKRKEIIIAAAAKIIVEDGINTLTHRKVAEAARVPLGSTTQYFASIDALKLAALHYLVNDIDAQIQEYATMLAKSQDIAKDLSNILSAYLSNTKNVRVEATFQMSDLGNPELQVITRHWHDSLVNMLTTRIGYASAESISLFIDGVIFQTATLGVTPSKALLASSIANLLEVRE